MKIGILGGGQLGRMFIQNALKYDDEFYVLDSEDDSPCSDICKIFTKGNFRDYEDVLDFGRDKDVVTIEIEHVNVKALFELEKNEVKIIPRPNIIEIIQQKILQKEFYRKHNIPSPKFRVIQSTKDCIFPKFPFVQKLNTGGYDGRGVQVIRTENDLSKLWNAPSVIEEFVDIDKELSVILAKNENGEEKVFPVTEMLVDKELNLLDFNVCPANIPQEVMMQIDNIVGLFSNAVDSPGLFAIELFLDKQGKVWVNETAPRPHNSGHQTQEGNLNSQFEQMYRAVKNLPLAETNVLCCSGMLNLIGSDHFFGEVEYQGLEKVLKIPRTYVHLYGKRETKPGRKMGHINVLADCREELKEKMILVRESIKVISKKNDTGTK